ncbi:MAG: ribosome recycling factor [Bacteroidales bacterium]|jgi:ribosome recycling factor|nr:ribosome recycling factor [Bacteroidales bacterium]
MEEEVLFVTDLCKEKMQSAKQHLEKELLHVRAGKAVTSMLDGVLVPYYGTMTPLAQVANLNTPDARTIAVQPWEKNMIAPIEKAILTANLGFNPDNNGEVIRINVPPLTEERRRSLSKQVAQLGEQARVSIRMARKDANDSLKKLVKSGLGEDIEKDAEEDVQKFTDQFIKEIDAMLEKKNREIFTI